VDELLDRYLNDPETCFKTAVGDNKNNQNLSDPGWRRDLCELPKNEIEDFSSGR
jgi:hypothetical protein